MDYFLSLFHWQKQLKGGMVYFGSRFEGMQSIMVRKAWRQEREAAAHTASRVRKQRQMLVLSSLVSLFCSAGPQLWGRIVHMQSGNTRVTQPRNLLTGLPEAGPFSDSSSSHTGHFNTHTQGTDAAFPLGTFSDPRQGTGCPKGTCDA